MKKIIAVMAVLVAGFCVGIPNANAQSVGIGVHIGGHHSGVNIGIGVGGYGYGRGCYDYSCGPVYYPPRPVYTPPAPVYYPPCDYGCGRPTYDAHPPVVVRVQERVVINDRVWDPACGRYVMRPIETFRTRTVTAYWDYNYGGYYWVDSYGNRVPVNY